MPLILVSDFVCAGSWYAGTFEDLQKTLNTRDFVSFHNQFVGVDRPVTESSQKFFSSLQKFVRGQSSIDEIQQLGQLVKYSPNPTFVDMGTMALENDLKAKIGMQDGFQGKQYKSVDAVQKRILASIQALQSANASPLVGKFEAEQFQKTLAMAQLEWDHTLTSRMRISILNQMSHHGIPWTPKNAKLFAQTRQALSLEPEFAAELKVITDRVLNSNLSPETRNLITRELEARPLPRGRACDNALYHLVFPENYEP